MILIFLLPLVGILMVALINRFFPRAKFRGADILPFFFLPSCELITRLQNRPSFLPYGFLFFFILVIILAIRLAVKHKNISFWHTIHYLWAYLNICSLIWYLGLVFLLFI